MTLFISEAVGCGRCAAETGEGKPAFIPRKEWEGASREKVADLWWFGGWGTRNSGGLSHRVWGIGAMSKARQSRA